MTARKHRAEAFRRGEGWAASCDDCEAVTFGGFPTKRAALNALDHDVEDKNAPEAAPTATEGESKSRANGSQSNIPTASKEQNVMSIIPPTTDNGNDDAEQHVHIPFVSPELAAFQRLVDANPKTTLDITAPDPDQATPCPAWCAGGHTATDRMADKVHRSEDIVLALRGNPAVRGTRVFMPHMVVRLEQTHTSVRWRPRLILALRRREHNKPGAVWTEDVAFSGGPMTARELRDALDVAIRAMDPDSEFDAAAPKTEA